MSTQTKRIQCNGWCIDVTEEPWLIKAMTYALVGIWMLLMFATIQMYGPSPWVLGSGVVVLLAGMGWVLGQRMSYLRIPGRIELGMHPPKRRREEEADDWREENR